MACSLHIKRAGGIMDPVGRDKVLHFLSSAMSVAGAKHKVVASNIANVDTPGYRAKKLNFESVMRDVLDDLEGTKMNALGRLGDELSEAGLPVYLSQETLWQRLDGNNVDLEKEMIALNEANTRFNTAARLFNIKFKQLKDQVQAR
ncbi:MAG: flagellar basal body rod protein FlgB [Acidobacteria bacterium]|nr:MAG: flagellar basal body rod protein FlgB [Acidobacteriota bacterium]